MNPNIRRGNEAVLRGDYDTAIKEFYEAIDSPDATVKRIAENRLWQLCPERVIGSTSSMRYHRDTCQGGRKIWSNHLVNFSDWREAESAQYEPCPKCNPPRPEPPKIRNS